MAKKKQVGIGQSSSEYIIIKLKRSLFIDIRYTNTYIEDENIIAAPKMRNNYGAIQCF